MSTEANHGNDKEVPSHSTIGRGHLGKGKWYCECDRPAKCVTTKKSGPNKGRKRVLYLFYVFYLQKLTK
jgi:hypothetical protein